MSTFIDDLNMKLSRLAAVGLVIGQPEKANLKESLVVETIIAKLPDEYKQVKTILYAQRPFTLAMVCVALDNKRRGIESTAHKVSTQLFAPSIKQ
jgi:hypothetical protein